MADLRAVMMSGQNSDIKKSFFFLCITEFLTKKEESTKEGGATPTASVHEITLQ